MSSTPSRVAIVTGGASGIGLAIATKFSQNGIFTVAIGRDEAKLAKAKEILGSNGTTIQADVADLASIPALVEKIHANYGRIDILVNNAGINQKKPFTEVTDEEFQRVINTNLTAVFVLSREVVKKMLAQGGGSIIHISSMAAYYGLPKVIAYSASKTAIEGITRAMATELSAQGIQVNAIAPGFIVTDM
ncbi:MAG TPA: SDR family oxidoreductase, partial [Flavihumibacter sp.]|nr:SDR family oxidoreductase [Flavihumibacter sp.]